MRSADKRPLSAAVGGRTIVARWPPRPPMAATGDRTLAKPSPRGIDQVRTQLSRRTLLPYLGVGSSVAAIGAPARAQPATPTKGAGPAVPRYDAVVVGAGFAGLAAAR